MGQINKQKSSPTKKTKEKTETFLTLLLTKWFSKRKLKGDQAPFHYTSYIGGAAGFFLHFFVCSGFCGIFPFRGGVACWVETRFFWEVNVLFFNPGRTASEAKSKKRSGTLQHLRTDRAKGLVETQTYLQNIFANAWQKKMEKHATHANMHKNFNRGA